jgi:hypothetical protein
MEVDGLDEIVELCKDLSGRLGQTAGMRIEGQEMPQRSMYIVFQPSSSLQIFNLLIRANRSSSIDRTSTANRDSPGYGSPKRSKNS